MWAFEEEDALNTENIRIVEEVEARVEKTLQEAFALIKSSSNMYLRKKKKELQRMKNSLSPRHVRYECSMQKQTSSPDF